MPWARLLFGFLILVFVSAVVTDRQETLKLLKHADWFLVLAAIAATFISYALASFGYAIANSFFGLEVERLRLFAIGFVTIAFNHLITMGGTVGYSIRVMLMRGTRTRGRDILAASIFHSYANLLIIVLALPFSLIYIIASHKIPTNVGLAIQISFWLFLLFFVFFSLAIFSAAVRRRLFAFSNKLISWISKKNFSETFQKMEGAFAEGVGMIKRSKKEVLYCLIVMLADWLLCFVSLWFCFRALNINLGSAFIASGFFIGVTVGLISMIPGGLGVQDLSEAAIYNLLGVSLSDAILVSVLFRIIYYLIPFLAGLVIYSRLISENRLKNNLVEENLIIE